MYTPFNYAYVSYSDNQLVRRSSVTNLRNKWSPFAIISTNTSIFSTNARISSTNDFSVGRIFGILSVRLSFIRSMRARVRVCGVEIFSTVG